MTTPVLDLPIEWKAPQRRSLPMFEGRLGDGYTINTRQGIAGVGETWDINSVPVTTARQEELAAFLAELGGGDPFLWSPDETIYPLREFTCEQWSFVPEGPGWWRLIASFEFTPPWKPVVANLDFMIPDWKFAGYREGGPMPTSAEIGWDLEASSTTLWGANAIVADGTDQGAKLQAILDQIPTLYPNRNFSQLVRLRLPAGTIRINIQIFIHPSYLILSGRGSDPITGTKILFMPDTNTRYDVDLNGSGSSDGEGFELNLMTWGGGDANGGWIFPGRACFKFQSKRVHLYYETEFATAPANRRDFYYGSSNFPWRSALRISQATAYPAREGEYLLPLEDDPVGVYVGSYILLYAANTRTMFNQMGVTDVNDHKDNPIVRTRIYRVTAVNLPTKTISIERPLEFDVPNNQTADGDLGFEVNSSYYSNIVVLDAVVGSGIEDLYLEQPMDTAPKLSDGTPYNLSPSQATHNYTNLAAEYAIHGIVFKWAASCWARRVRTFMTGSHAIASEFTKNTQIEDCHFDGSWNKGKGGNGYTRLSKAWDLLFQRNTSRNLRHLTLQWSASHCVLKENDLDCDLNLHGGWERYNLLERNTVIVPYEHRFGSISTDPTQGSNWFPIWWGAGLHAGNWSGSTGARNHFFRNNLQKQTAPGGPFNPYEPYASLETVYIFGSDSAKRWAHLKENGSDIPAWSQREQINYSAPPNSGVLANSLFAGASLHDAARATVKALPALPDDPARSFNPATLPGYTLHLSGKDSIVTLDSSNKVVSATDISGNGYTINQFAADSGPTLGSLNGSPSFQFGGASGLLIPAAVLNVPRSTWIMLIRTAPDTANRGRIVEALWSDRAYHLYPSGTNFDQLLLAFFSGTSFVDGITAPVGEVPKGTWRAIAFTLSGPEAIASLWVDGAFTRRTKAYTGPTGSFTKCTIGRRNNGTESFTGQVAELIICQGALGAVDQYNGMRHLLSKRGL